MDAIAREILFNRVRSWVLDAASIIRKKINDPRIINTKSNPNDLVTEMDRKVEQFFAQKIKQFYPEHLLLSEEGFGDHLSNNEGTVWIIDPIDGTTNFVHQKRNFAISVAVYHHGIGEIAFIFDVTSHNLYSAMRDNGAYKNDKLLPLLKDEVQLNEAVLSINPRLLIENDHYEATHLQQLVKEVRAARAYGSAAIEFAYVAEGAIDAYITLSLEPWDFAAGKIILKEVNGVVSSATGAPVNMIKRSSIIACNTSVHDSIVDNYLKKALKVL